MTRFDRYRIRKGLILAFHGCDSDVAHSVVQGGDLARSENTYDWLGHGVYFWENNPERALEWAEHAAKRGRLKSPAVLGAIIDLGHCLDLTESVGCDEVAEIHETIKLIETANPDLIPPVNKGKTNDRILRHRDCHVINQLHRQREQRATLPTPRFAPPFTKAALSTKMPVSLVALTFKSASATKAPFLATFCPKNPTHDPEIGISKLSWSWKNRVSYYARSQGIRLSEANSVWQREYWDRFIRDEKHYHAAIAYILDKPVSAGLCAREEWPWSSRIKT